MYREKKTCASEERERNLKRGGNNENGCRINKNFQKKKKEKIFVNHIINMS